VVSATDAVSLGNKFAEVASQLSQGPRNAGNEAQIAKEASMSRACANIVDDILPIVVRVIFSLRDYDSLCTL